MLASVLPLAAYSTQGEEIGEKRIAVAMRMIGHEVLRCLGDEESRILPIEQIDDYYKIPFEVAFGFNPDDIVSVIERVMAEARIARYYLVEVEDDATKEVVYNFMVGDPGMIPCEGRMLPVARYSLLITTLDHLFSEAEVPAMAREGSSMNTLTPTQDQAANATSKAAFLLLPLFILVGVAAYFIRKKKPEAVDPDLILIGSSQFDKKNMALSFENKRVELSHKETELLSLLYTAANTPLERDVILQSVWGDEGDYVGRTLDVFISKLRKKLKADASVKIVNIRGIGYKLVMDVPKEN